MEHDRFYMVDISLQVKELLCLFKEAHVSIRTQVFCPSPKGNSYQALNNASVINKVRTLVCLELVSLTSWRILIAVVCWAASVL
jgi:hypothetical protein